jgi:hypothetical protein
VIGEFAVADGSRKRLGVKEAVAANFGFRAPIYIFMLHRLNMTSPLRFFWSMRFLRRPLAPRFDDLFSFVAGIREDAKSVTIV